jgi:hypothetical protein
MELVEEMMVKWEAGQGPEPDHALLYAGLPRLLTRVGRWSFRPLRGSALSLGFLLLLLLLLLLFNCPIACTACSRCFRL